MLLQNFITLFFDSIDPIPFSILVITLLITNFLILPAIEKRKKKKQAQESYSTFKNTDDVAVYTISGVRGKHLTVYKDKCIIKTTGNAGSLVMGNFTNGEKVIYYSDCIGMQFRKSGTLIGYLQIETASSSITNKRSNISNENSFTFDKSKVSNEKMEEVAAYIKNRIEQYKTQNSTASTTIIQNNSSSADELKKFKELLDMGAITQEEFDAKKKELLGL